MGDRLANVGRKVGACLFQGGDWGAGHNMAWAEAYLRTMRHPNPSNRLAQYIHQRHKQTGQTDNGPIAQNRGRFMNLFPF